MFSVKNLKLITSHEIPLLLVVCLVEDEEETRLDQGWVTLSSFTYPWSGGQADLFEGFRLAVNLDSKALLRSALNAAVTKPDGERVFTETTISDVIAEYDETVREYLKKGGKPATTEAPAA